MVHTSDTIKAGKMKKSLYVIVHSWELYYYEPAWVLGTTANVHVHISDCTIEFIVISY